MKKLPTLSVISKKTPTEMFFDAINKFGQKTKSNKPIFNTKVDSYNKQKETNFIDDYDERINEKVCFEMGGIGFDLNGNPIRWE
jgi:hypothetical protein